MADFSGVKREREIMEREGGDPGGEGRGEMTAVPSGRGGGRGRAGLWGRGWKRIAIAGAAISSAPVVLPPLLLLSAVGLALSVPFGVFFAGYACTDKIMRALLPPPDPSPGAPWPAEAEEQDGGKEEEEEVEGGAEKDGRFREVEADKGRMEIGLADQEGRLVGEPAEVEEEPGREIFREEGGGEEEEERQVVAPPKADEVAVSAAPEGEEKRADGIVGEGRRAEEEKEGKEGISAPETQEKLVEEEEVEKGVVAPVGADDGGFPTTEGGRQEGLDEDAAAFGTGKESIPARVPEDGGAVEKAIEERKRVQEVEKGEATIPAGAGGRSIISAPEEEGEPVEEKEIQAVRDEEEEGLLPVERVERENIAAPEGEELAKASPAAAAVTVLEHEIPIEPSSMGPAHTAAVEERLSDAPDAESAGSVEDLFSEEKIWEQIDAIRTIVGCKAPRRSSCIEELKVLYLLMGIEPAISFVEGSGVEDVNDNLQFLKSIIGVK